MKDIITRLVDRSEFEEYKRDYGKSIICGYARIDGWAVGIVANQRKLVKTKKLSEKSWSVNIEKIRNKPIPILLTKLCGLSVDWVWAAWLSTFLKSVTIL